MVRLKGRPQSSRTSVNLRLNLVVPHFVFWFRSAAFMDRPTRSKSRSLLDSTSKAPLFASAWFSHARVPAGLRLHAVFLSKSLDVVFVLTDTTTSRVFGYRIHLKPFLRLEYVELRDCGVFRFAPDPA